MFIVTICIVLQMIYLNTASRVDVDSIEPGQCLSRFDYDYKVMQKLLELESSIKDLKKTKDKCQERSSQAFMAQLSTSISEPEVGTTVVFDSVVTNEGQGYNPVTGLFVAAVGGTYNIHLTASSPVKGLPAHLHLYLMRNSEKIGYLFLDDNNDRWLQRSVAVVTHLDIGDRVCVKIGNTRGSVTLAGCCFHTHFNGFLIHKD